jgi:hypothetical protein
MISVVLRASAENELFHGTIVAPVRLLQEKELLCLLFLQFKICSKKSNRREIFIIHSATSVAYQNSTHIIEKKTGLNINYESKTF